MVENLIFLFKYVLTELTVTRLSVQLSKCLINYVNINLVIVAEN